VNSLWILSIPCLHCRLDEGLTAQWSGRTLPVKPLPIGCILVQQKDILLLLLLLLLFQLLLLVTVGSATRPCPNLRLSCNNTNKMLLSVCVCVSGCVGQCWRLLWSHKSNSNVLFYTFLFQQWFCFCFCSVSASVPELSSRSACVLFANVNQRRVHRTCSISIG